MSDEEIIASIDGILVEEFEIDKENLDPAASILEVLKIDSLDLIDLVVLIEKKFGFKVQSGEMGSIKTLQDFHNYIIQRLNQKG